LCVIKKPRTRGGYSPARWLQNTNPQWVVVPVEKKSDNSNQQGFGNTDQNNCLVCVIARLSKFRN